MGETKNGFRRRCREVYLAYRINCMPGGKACRTTVKRGDAEPVEAIRVVGKQDSRLVRKQCPAGGARVPLPAWIRRSTIHVDTPNPPKADQNFWHPVDAIEEETPMPADPYSSPSSDSPERREQCTKEGKAPSENLVVPRNHMGKEEYTPEVDGQTSLIFKDI